VGALSHYLEHEGVPTAHISLIREQTVAMRPPRALWVPFMLGRPLGAPDAPAFQLRVLRALLSLFERTGPAVLDDFPEDAPVQSDPEAGFVCPVSFAPGPAGLAEPGRALIDEMARLAPWYDLARTRRGRTTVGVFGATADDAARHLSRCLNGSTKAPTGLTAALALKRACDDIRAYYFEAASARPGNLVPDAINHWFWQETAAGRAMLEMRRICLESGDDTLRNLGRQGLIPRAVIDATDAGQAAPSLRPGPETRRHSELSGP